MSAISNFVDDILEKHALPIIDYLIFDEDRPPPNTLFNKARRLTGIAIGLPIVCFGLIVTQIDEEVQGWKRYGAKTKDAD